MINNYINTTNKHINIIGRWNRNQNTISFDQSANMLQWRQNFRNLSLFLCSNQFKMPEWKFREEKINSINKKYLVIYQYSWGQRCEHKFFSSEVKCWFGFILFFFSLLSTASIQIFSKHNCNINDHFIAIWSKKQFQLFRTLNIWNNWYLNIV